MRRLIIQFFVFISLLMLLFLVGLIMPTTTRVKDSLLFAKAEKDSTLKNIPSPRIILVGGSSVSMSLNSQLIKDSLQVNPINTGIQAPLGLVYMMDTTLDYVKKGDVIVMAAEYQHFFGEFAYGKEDLMRLVFDVDINNYKKLSWRQIKNIYSYIPKYSLSKFSIPEYKEYDGPPYYKRDCFNQYGDAVVHWDMKEENKIVMEAINEEINLDVFEDIAEFNKKLTKKGARLLITYPPFEKRSYDSNTENIKAVEKEYKKLGITILGKPEQYRTANDLMFDSPYHMNKKGLDIRTQMLIKDLKNNGNLKP